MSAPDERFEREAAHIQSLPPEVISTVRGLRVPKGPWRPELAAALRPFADASKKFDRGLGGHMMTDRIGLDSGVTVGDLFRAADAFDALAFTKASATGKSEAPAHRFPNVFCSQCGGKFGPGDAGFGHCSDHQHQVDLD